MKNKLLVTTALIGLAFSLPAWAVTYTVDTNLNDKYSDGKIESNSYGIYASGADVSFTTPTIDIEGKASALLAWDGEVLVGGENTETINLKSSDKTVWAYVKGVLDISGKNINIETLGSSETSDSSGALFAQNASSNAKDNLATINVKGENINISAPTSGGNAVVAMSQGVVNIEGNTTITAENAIIARGKAQVNINESGEYTTKMDGNISFDYHGASSGTPVDAMVNVTLAGADSYWNGNTIVAYDKKPSDDQLRVTQATVTLKDGAIWNATAITDNEATETGSYYIALNNLNIDNGTVNIADTTRGVAVDTIAAKDAMFNGGVLNVNYAMNVEGELTLNNNVDGDGTINFAKDTTLNVSQNTTIANAVTSEGTTLNVVLNKGADKLELNDIFKNNSNVDNLANFNVNLENALYTLVQNPEDSSLYEVVQNSAADVASSLGVTGATAGALIAAVSSAEETSNAAFNAVSDALYDAAQKGDTAAVREAEKLGASAAPVARVVETMRSNMIFAAVNDELNGAGGAMAEGMSSGDYFRKAKAWIRGLYNYADKDGTSKAAGFDADTYGVAMGIDKELDNHVKAGLGYAYSQTDINSNGRDTDVDSNTLFVYGQYKPADWYINAALAYSWSDYDEKKSVLGYNADAKYDVDTIALQSMYGFERKLGEYDLNPEFGFRYMHFEQDGYTDNLGSKVKSKDSDVLTLVAGAKVAKDYELDCGTILRPELKAAVTYDVVSDDNNTNVMLPNGAGYRVNGEKLDRLGVELGVKVAADIAENWELSTGYEIRLREDYQDNTLMLNAKYSF